MLFRSLGKGTSAPQPASKVPRREWKSLNLGFEFVQKMAFGEDAVEEDVHARYDEE